MNNNINNNNNNITINTITSPPSSSLTSTTLQESSNLNLLPPSSHQKKGYWYPEEDQKLEQLYNEDVDNVDWGIIASKFENRTAKQCRERWNEYLSPNIDHSPFTIEEDFIIMRAQAHLGNKWKEITDLLPIKDSNKKRTPTSVKVQWHCLERKIRRAELNSIYGSQLFSRENMLSSIGSHSSSILPQQTPQSIQPTHSQLSQSLNQNQQSQSQSQILQLQHHLYQQQQHHQHHRSNPIPNTSGHYFSPSFSIHVNDNSINKNSTESCPSLLSLSSSHYHSSPELKPQSQPDIETLQLQSLPKLSTLSLPVPNLLSSSSQPISNSVLHSNEINCQFLNNNENQLNSSSIYLGTILGTRNYSHYQDDIPFQSKVDSNIEENDSNSLPNKVIKLTETNNQNIQVAPSQPDLKLQSKSIDMNHFIGDPLNQSQLNSTNYHLINPPQYVTAQLPYLIKHPNADYSIFSPTGPNGPFSPHDFVSIFESTKITSPSSEAAEATTTTMNTTPFSSTPSTNIPIHFPHPHPLTTTTTNTNTSTSVKNIIVNPTTSTTTYFP